MLKALGHCRTPYLGAHKIACTQCGQVQIAYNSCRNRNCPNCQARARQEWVAARASELLPVPYFHLVFTLPDELNPLCRKYPVVMYNLLFRVSWYTVQKLGKDTRWMGAQTGMVAILHTWGSNMSLHPHLHCMIPAGGMNAKGKWKQSKSSGRYLYNRSVMGLVFRAHYVKLLRKALASGKIPKDSIPPGLFRKLFLKEWITFAKRPFRQAQHIVNYIGRYSHSIAMSNHRLQKLEAGKVSFTYKNYRKGGQEEEMELDEWEFIRRFAMHIIPHRFVRIRHYGILSNRIKKKALKAIRKNLKLKSKAEIKKEKHPFDPYHQLHYCQGCRSTTPHLILDILQPIRAGPVGNKKIGTTK